MKAGQDKVHSGFGVQGHGLAASSGVLQASALRLCGDLPRVLRGVA